MKPFNRRTVIAAPAYILGSFFFVCSCLPAAEIQVRLQTPITSYSSKPGTVFECTVLSPWVVNDRVVIPEGSKVHGHVEEVLSVGMGIRHERARLKLVFEDFVTQDGVFFPLHAHLASVDNAREQVTKDGTIRGVLAARQPNEYVLGLWRVPSMRLVELSMAGTMGLTRVINSALSLGPIGAGGLMALRFGLFRFPEPEIQLPSGADLLLTVDDPATQPGLSEDQVAPPPAPAGVADLLAKEPFSVSRADKSMASDIVNVAFLGSREQLVSAFSAAGWTEADRRTRRTMTKTYFSYSQMRAYANAPVSAMLYKGELPELVFEKTLNTIAKRHHIRVWYGGVVDGRELWLGAATHDTGLAHKPQTTFSFTHKIDPNVDEERGKVVTDLRFAGCIEPEMRVARPEAASSAIAGGNVTDGAVSVIALTNCSSTEIAAGKMPQPGTKFTRLGRRLILESRNHLLRENYYYVTYQFLRQRYVNHVAKKAELAAAFRAMPAAPANLPLPLEERPQ